jgi:hypothetical protein
MNNRVTDPIVGDRQACPDILAVTLLDRSVYFLLILGEISNREASLCSIRNNDDILDPLGIHQTEHLGAIVIIPFAPSDSATSDRISSKMCSLEKRGTDEKLKLRPWLGYDVNLFGVKLEGEGTPLSMEKVCPHSVFDQGEERSQDAVSVDLANRGEEFDALLFQRLKSGGAILCRAKRRVKASYKKAPQ